MTCTDEPVFISAASSACGWRMTCISAKKEPSSSRRRVHHFCACNVETDRSFVCSAELAAGVSEDRGTLLRIGKNQKLQYIREAALKVTENQSANRKYHQPGGGNHDEILETWHLSVEQHLAVGAYHICQRIGIQ